MKRHIAPVPTSGRQMSLMVKPSKVEAMTDVERVRATTTLALILIYAAGLIVEEFDGFQRRTDPHATPQAQGNRLFAVDAHGDWALGIGKRGPLIRAGVNKAGALFSKLVCNPGREVPQCLRTVSGPGLASMGNTSFSKPAVMPSDTSEAISFSAKVVLA